MPKMSIQIQSIEEEHIKLCERHPHKRLRHDKKKHKHYQILFEQGPI